MKRFSCHLLDFIVFILFITLNCAIVAYTSLAKLFYINLVGGDNGYQLVDIALQRRNQFIQRHSTLNFEKRGHAVRITTEFVCHLCSAVYQKNTICNTLRLHFDIATNWRHYDCPQSNQQHTKNLEIRTQHQ